MGDEIKATGSDSPFNTKDDDSHNTEENINVVSEQLESNENDVGATVCLSKSRIEKDNVKIFKEPAKAKLRFGIEAILNVKERRETTSRDLEKDEIYDKDDSRVHELRDKNGNKIEQFKSNFDRAYMDSVLSRETDDEEEDDDERIKNENKDFKDLHFDLDIARARLAYMGYAATLPATCMTETGTGNGLSLQPGSFSPPFPVTNSSGYPWTAVGDLRKERFSMVRRIGHPYQNRTPPKRKKPRTSFTRLQILELEKRFERQKYLASTERSALAKSLKMTDAQVKTWFQNRRTKWRRQTAEEREIERQAANRLLMSLQSDPAHRKSAMVMSPESVCLSHLQRWQEKRASDI